MRDLAMRAYEQCKVSEVGHMKPDRPIGFDLDKFQTVVLAAADLEVDGLISIIDVHRDGNGFVDDIEFRRLK